MIKVRRKLSWKSSVIASRTEQPHPDCSLRLLGRSSYIQFGCLVFGPTAPLNPPGEDLSLCLNVMGSHASFACPSTYSGEAEWSQAGLLEAVF